MGACQFRLEWPYDIDRASGLESAGTAARSTNLTVQPLDHNPITVVPATQERWPDIEELFARTACWCQYWRVSACEYGRASTSELGGGRLAEGREALRNQLERPTPPGMLAYIDGRLPYWNCLLSALHNQRQHGRVRLVLYPSRCSCWKQPAECIGCVPSVKPNRLNPYGSADCMLRPTFSCLHSHGGPHMPHTGPYVPW